MKNKWFVILFPILLFFISCGEYGKVINRGTPKEKLSLANKLYEAQKFNKAARVLEQTVSDYAGKPQLERIQFMIAQSYYNLENYQLASYYFERFVKNYPESSKKETADFLVAESSYLASPKYNLDQQETHKSILYFQNFIDKYPDSKKRAYANKRIKELNLKLETKAFNIAKLYHKTENYNAAIVAFDNLILDYLGTKYREEALFLKFKSAYELGTKSVQSKKKIRINNAIKAFEKLKRNYPKSPFLKEANKYHIKLITEIS